MKPQIPYKNFEHFTLRTPLFPVDFIKNLVSPKYNSDDELKNLFKQDVIKEAIFLASPDLFNELNRWTDGGLTEKIEIDKLKISLLSYLIRMSARCTPFGLFAGFTRGCFGDKTQIVLPRENKNSRHTRLDMDYLGSLVQDLAKNQIIKENLKYYPNSSIYRVGNHIRYVEYRYGKNNKRTHHIVSVDFSDYLKKILNASENGEYRKNLINTIIDNEIDYDTARDFMDEIINSQLLVNELEPSITGPEFLEQILKTIDDIKDVDDIKQTLIDIKNILNEIDHKTIGTTVSFYNDIFEKLNPLNTEIKIKHLFQADMVKPTETCTINAAIINDVFKAIEIMNRLSPYSQNNNLANFKKVFYERYEDDEVPLIKALDTEAGVGYKQSENNTEGDVTPLVEDILLINRDNQFKMNWNKIQNFIFSKYIQAIHENKYEIEFIDKELEQFEYKWDDLPDTFSAMINIVEDNNNPTNKERFYIHFAGNSSAVNLLGRFCHADAETFDFVKQIIAKEDENINENSVYAEIIHLPEERTGNVLLHPVFRKYEIPYLAKSSVSEDFQIKSDDIMISVRFDKIILRSKKLNKEIIPRLSTAHNYSFNALPIYQFLCDMQTQNIRGGLGFHWGTLENEYVFLPRVCYKNIIFSLAAWNIKKEKITSLLKIKDDENLFSEFQKLRNSLKIPLWVNLVEGDNELLLNLENILCIKTLLSLTKNREQFKLTEFIFNTNNAVVKSEKGSFTNEIILSFYKDKSAGK